MKTSIPHERAQSVSWFVVTKSDIQAQLWGYVKDIVYHIKVRDIMICNIE